MNLQFMENVPSYKILRFFSPTQIQVNNRQYISYFYKNIYKRQ